MNEQEYDQAKTEEDLGVRGFFHLHIVDPDGTIAGDSGWKENQVTNLGFNKYLVSALGSISGSLYVSHMALGSGTIADASATTLDGEVGTRQAVSAATTTGSKTAQFTATFAAGWHSSAGAFNIANIGLFNSLTTGTLFAGNTYASSSCASNQAVRSNWRRLVEMLIGKLHEFGGHLFETIPSQQNALAFGRV